jgi:hypothetical protein
MVASPSTREWNYIRADMILAKELEGLIRWRIPFIDESVQALLPSCHSRYEAPSESYAILAGPFSAGSADTLDS